MNAAAFTLAILGLHWCMCTNGDNSWTLKKLTHKPRSLSQERMKELSDLSNHDRLTKVELAPMLMPRVPGTAGNTKCQQHIISRLQNLDWEIELDEFEENTPYGTKPFTNIIATWDPHAPRRLVLACHFDSKYFKDFEFIGATDSAVPCAMILDLAYTLDKYLKKERKQAQDVTLQLLFFDGEEAFRDWTDTDSIYGARHLSQAMKNRVHPMNNEDGTNLLHGIDMLVLLDLIGAANPRFSSYFDGTSKMFDRLIRIEKTLAKQDLLVSHSKTANQYFNTRRRGHNGIAEDDHIPFMKKGVRVLHLIPMPFPDVWHTQSDDGHHVDHDTVDNLNKIMRVFVAEYLHLPV
ncbi:PREDICTED: glutaminyl-peptide cyclotransferase-like [Priapulus caudatus]|uniref:glutaminyl-peptide cyclotransferase n=1 Tax=Priapulus caudatus TaxID=37621 RepID=A0ABM1EIY6_PRICU|nr:PREDICTED: glutaminyl-peptide cyclotransferase-like [Priapulus caudatus]XP_014672157.1 PREDICTED: glutaminyl-peptide cyclotransferase-like [Priapulus caudatus]XP_014672158.1 PREDICTED: glutaminyl-peptide cyclotransferase-like [Priapulus caudatus]